MAKRKKVPGKSSEYGLENYTHPDLFGKWLGYEIVRFDRKKLAAEVSLKLRADHLSPAQRVHGGVISALFDYSSGAAVFASLKPKDFCSTVELKVNYLLPLYLGDTVRTISKVIFRGKRLCVIHSFLYRNAEKRPSAMATATFNVGTASRALGRD